MQKNGIILSKNHSVYVNKMRDLIEQGKYSYIALADSFDSTGKKKNGSFGSEAITGNKGKRISSTAVLTVLWISELVIQKEKKVKFMFELNKLNCKYDTDVYNLNCAEFRAWIIINYHTYNGPDRNWHIERQLQMKWMHSRIVQPRSTSQGTSFPSRHS